MNGPQKKLTKKSDTFIWCRSCKRSHNQTIKHHIHSDKHKAMLEYFLNQEFDRIKNIKYFGTNVHIVMQDSPPAPFSCFCCEDKQIDTSKNEFIG